MRCNIHTNTEMICIEDFCGGGVIQGSTKYQINLWADWCSDCKKVYFGGYWSEIPDFCCENEPDINEENIVAHIKKYEPLCETAYQKYIFRTKG